MPTPPGALPPTDRRRQIVAEAIARGEPVPLTVRERRERQKVERREAKLAALREKREALEDEIRQFPDFNAERMRQAVNVGVARVLDLWADPDLKATQAQGLAISLGVLIDKRRLLDEKPTSIHGTANVDRRELDAAIAEAREASGRRLAAVPDAGQAATA